MSKIKAGITGASGYAGVEIVKLLARHPDVELACVTSRSLAGTLVADSMPALRHLLPGGMKFAASSPEEQAEMDVDVWFLALPHGAAAEYAKALVGAGKTVIDLSADFLPAPDTPLYESITMCLLPAAPARISGRSGTRMLVG